MIWKRIEKEMSVFQSDNIPIIIYPDIQNSTTGIGIPRYPLKITILPRRLIFVSLCFRFYHMVVSTKQFIVLPLSSILRIR